MTHDRWEQLKENLKRRFEVVEETTEDLIHTSSEGQIKQGEREILVVKTPAGKIRLVCEIRPMVLEKKFHYTHRQGQSAQTEYRFSDTEKTYKLRLFKLDEYDEWKELDENAITNF